jgi:GT2 family glycosyltransferase
MVKYSVIILIYHRTPELVEMGQNCLASVLNTINPKTTEVIVVDNGSTVKGDWSGAKYIDLKENKGISAGWNAGIKASKGKYVVILGDDTIVHGDWLKELEKCFKEPRCGVANLHMEHLPHGIGIKEDYKWYSGACFMLSRETIKKVGLFDENIWPCNWEDADYWLRVYKAGLKLYKNFTISIQHLEGATLHAKDLSAYFIKNKEYVVKKHGFDPTGVFYGIDSIYKRLS